jgi:hypothetical protein
MKKNTAVNGGMTGLTMMALLLLPGCGILDLIKSKLGEGSSSSAQVSTVTSSSLDDGSKVLMSIDGKAMITEKTFNEYYEQFVAANPRLQSMIQFMPNAKKEIFNGMANERVLLAWGDKQGLHESEDYRKEFEQGVRMIKIGLAAKQFEKDLVGKVPVTDKELHEYYDSHKDPELVSAPGGIKTEGMEFDSKDEAQAFFDKVKADPKGFKAAGGSEVKEFAPVNKFSFDVDKAVKEKIVDLTSFPKVLMVEGSDKKYWVVAALSKEETQYRSFDEVKEGLQKMIEREKMMKIYTDKISGLKKQYNVVEDEKFFEVKLPTGAPGMSPTQPIAAPIPSSKNVTKAL